MAKNILEKVIFKFGTHNCNLGLRKSEAPLSVTEKRTYMYKL